MKLCQAYVNDPSKIPHEHDPSREKFGLFLNSRKDEYSRKQTAAIGHLYKYLECGFTQRSISRGVHDASKHHRTFEKSNVETSAGPHGNSNTGISQGTLRSSKAFELQSKDVTISYKIKLETFEDSHTVCSFDNGDNTEQLLIQHVSGGRCRVKFNTINGIDSITLPDSEIPGEWFEYTIQFKDNNLNIVRDSKLIYSSVISPILFVERAYLEIRSRNYGTRDLLKGSLSDFHIFNAALSQDNIGLSEELFSTKSLQHHIINQTTVNNGTTYYINLKGPDIPVVGTIDGDHILDFSVLGDPRFNKSTNLYWGSFMDPWFYYDSDNPYHAKLKDFHYDRVNHQMQAEKDFIFSKFIFERGFFVEVTEVFIYAKPQSAVNVEKLKDYILLLNQDRFYLEEDITFTEDGMFLEDGLFLRDAIYKDHYYLQDGIFLDDSVRLK